jgi:lysozyme family protein
MAKDNFDAVMDEVLSHEGGYVNHPRDPGGETNFGISKRSYPKEDIRRLTRHRAKTIYRRDFWGKVRGDDLRAGVDLVVMDASVNSGAKRGVSWAQKAVGMTGQGVDGIVGPATVRALNHADPFTTIKRACAYRMGFLRGLKTWGTFGKGWSRRVASVEARAMAMAAKAEGSPGYARKVLKDNGASAKTSQQMNANSGHVTATGGAVSGGYAEGIRDLPTWAPILFIAVMLAVALWFYGRSRHDKNRVEAYRNELEKVS